MSPLKFCKGFSGIAYTPCFGIVKTLFESRIKLLFGHQVHVKGTWWLW